MARVDAAIRIGAVDDHPIILTGLAQGLRWHIPEAVVGPVEVTVADLLKTAVDPLDLVLLDVELHDGSDPAANVEAVRSRLPGISMNVPQSTYLAWLDCSALGLDNPQQFFLEQAKVGLSAGLDFGDDCQQFVRLNFGCPRSLLEEGIARMERSLRNLHA